MIENTNKALAVNSVILYMKMFITTVCALLTTRFALKALGIVDFGLFSVLGGIISFIGIFNTIMSTTTDRFIAFALGRKDIEQANLQFNVNLILFISIGLIMAIVAFPVGRWYILNYVNYDGSIRNALLVFYISILGTIVSTLGTPFNGLLIAKENFIVFSLIDICSHLIRLVVALLLVNHFDSKLMIYTITISSMTALPTLVYWIYCKQKYKEIVKFKFVKEICLYKQTMSFSAWVGVGAVAQIGKQQGAALLINAFFNTVLNTALGIANSVMAYISMFAHNIAQPMLPQMTKSYASGDNERVENLLILSTKLTFLVMFIVSIPFLLAPDILLKIWLGEIPPYASMFLVLLIIDNLIQSLNSGVGNLIFASGKVALYQIAVSSLNLLSIIIAFILLKVTGIAYNLIVAYIIVTSIKFFVVQYILNKTLKFNTKLLIARSYIPSLLIILLFSPAFLFSKSSNSILVTSVCVCYALALVLFVGLNKNERKTIYRYIGKFIIKISKK